MKAILLLLREQYRLRGENPGIAVVRRHADNLVKLHGGEKPVEDLLCTWLDGYTLAMEQIGRVGI